MIIGDCKDHENPDLWFFEIGRGQATENRMKKLAIEVNTALAICNSCPVKSECLTEGMKPDNINYGIWGGLLAGERLHIAGEREGDHHRFTPQGAALNELSKLKPYLRRNVLS